MTPSIFPLFALLVQNNVTFVHIYIIIYLNLSVFLLMDRWVVCRFSDITSNVTENFLCLSPGAPVQEILKDVCLGMQLQG